MVPCNNGGSHVSNDAFPSYPADLDRVAKTDIKGSYELAPGRCIVRDGKRFISINRAGDTSPTDADDATHVIAALLNRAQEKREHGSESDRSFLAAMEVLLKLATGETTRRKALAEVAGADFVGNGHRLLRMARMGMSITTDGPTPS